MASRFLAIDRKCQNASGSGKIRKQQKHRNETGENLFLMSYENVKLKNGNDNCNSVFQSNGKTIYKLKIYFQLSRKTENENGISNSVFSCRRITVGTKCFALR